MRLSLAVTALVGVAAAAPSTTHAVHEKRDAAPIAWTKHTRAAKAQPIPVRIGLKQRNLENLSKHVEDVSDPDSPNFGRHWSAEKIANTFAPLKETSEQTVQWLINSGVEASRIKHSTGRNWIEFESTVEEAERLLNTQYHVYKHNDSEGLRVACDEYSLPHTVREHIDFIMPTIQLDGLNPVARKLVKFEASPDITGLTGTENCDKAITIDCLRARYNIPISNSHVANNKLGIVEWADYLYLPDLKTFFQNYTDPKIPDDTTPEFISIDGGKKGTYDRVKAGTAGESALDFQLAYPIVYPQEIRLYQVGDGVNVDSVGTFNIFLDALDSSYCTYEGGDAPYVDPAYPDPNDGGYTGPLQCGGAPKSNVYSISYGQLETALPVFYQQRQCHEWAKMALQGVSAIFASGDSGVANSYNSGYPDTCEHSEELRYLDVNGTRFNPSFPNNCPYVTNVGSTTTIGKKLSDGEQSTTRFGSGAGFSDVFGRPSWQDHAVENYLHKYAPKYSSKVFNNTGRAYPDVSAFGDNIVTVYDNKTGLSGGTSASAPIFASIVNRLNDERIAKGKGPIGFLNPTIYKHPEMFNDVTVGNSPGCGTDGFPTAPGWDPSSGMGTPNYTAMRKVFVEDLP